MKKLNMAAQEGKFAVVKQLIEQGISVNARADIKCSNGFYLKGSTPLHQACQNLHPEIVEYLLDNGAEVNAQAGEYKYTPLHAVALNIFTWYNVDYGTNKPSQRIAALLVKHGADLTLRLSRQAGSLTPLGSAEKSDTKSIIPLLIKAASSNALKAVPKEEGMISVRRMSRDQVKLATQLIIGYLLFEDQDLDIPESIEVVFDFDKKCIRIACPGSFEGNSDDLPRIIYSFISNLTHQDMMIVKHVISREMTGFGGLGTYKGGHILVTDVDIQKLKVSGDYRLQQLEAKIVKAEKQLAKLKSVVSALKPEASALVENKM